METNITFVCLYFCFYILQVLQAKLSLHVQLVMHNKLPVLVMALTSSNTNINQIIVTKRQKMHSQRNQMVGRGACTEVSFFPFSLPLSFSTLYRNPTNIHPRSKSFIAHLSGLIWVICPLSKLIVVFFKTPS